MLAETRSEEVSANITVLLVNVGVGLHSISDHRSTLTSSVVASSDVGSLSGYGYGPTLASSVVARPLRTLASSLVALRFSKLYLTTPLPIASLVVMTGRTRGSIKSDPSISSLIFPTCFRRVKAS